eukprot:2602507-Pyramimonas_sp.AAC.1
MRCTRPAVRVVKLSAAGLPMAVLGNRHCLVYHEDMRAWARVADDTFVGSDFVSTLALPPSAPGGALGSTFARYPPGDAWSVNAIWDLKPRDLWDCTLHNDLTQGDAARNV